MLVDQFIAWHFLVTYFRSSNSFMVIYSYKSWSCASWVFQLIFFPIRISFLLRISHWKKISFSFTVSSQPSDRLRWYRLPHFPYSTITWWSIFMDIWFREVNMVEIVIVDYASTDVFSRFYNEQSKPSIDRSLMIEFCSLAWRNLVTRRCCT